MASPSPSNVREIGHIKPRIMVIKEPLRGSMERPKGPSTKDRIKKKKTVLHPYNGILFSHKKNEVS